MKRGSIEYQKLLTAGLQQTAPLMLNLREGETADQVCQDMLDIMEGPLCMRRVPHVTFTPNDIESVHAASLASAILEGVTGSSPPEKALLYFHGFDGYPQPHKDVIYDIAMDRKINGVVLPEGWRIAFSVDNLVRFNAHEEGSLDTYCLESVTVIDPAFLNKLFLMALGGPA